MVYCKIITTHSQTQQSFGSRTATQKRRATAKLRSFSIRQHTIFPSSEKFQLHSESDQMYHISSGLYWSIYINLNTNICTNNAHSLILLELQKLHKHTDILISARIMGEGTAGIPPHCSCGPHVIHGVDVSASKYSRFRRLGVIPSLLFLSSTTDTQLINCMLITCILIT